MRHIKSILFTSICIIIIYLASLIWGNIKLNNNVYSKCYLIDIGMNVQDVYEIIDYRHKILVRQDKIGLYHHYIIYPARWVDDFGLEIEFDPKKNIVVNLNCR